MEQLALDFDVSLTQRARRVKQAHMASTKQQELFSSTPDWHPNIDIHLLDPSTAVGQIAGPQPDRAQLWLSSIVGSVRSQRPRRVTFSATALDRLLWLMPPANVTLDATCRSIGIALWAHRMGWAPLKVGRAGNRLLARSPRWPGGMNIKDVPWPAIACLSHFGVPLDIEPSARTLMAKRLTDAGMPLATATMAGSAVLLSSNRPEVLERLKLPALSFAGEAGTGNYKLPLLASAPLLDTPGIVMSDAVRQSITQASRAPKALHLGEDFPWTLYGFQAADAGRALHILKIAGGVLLAGEMGSGKGLHTQTILPTPNGTVQAGEVRIGDELLGPDALPTEVLGVYPQPEQSVYEVEFSDGKSIVCDTAHLWQVFDTSTKTTHVYSVAQLLTLGSERLTQMYIPLTQPIVQLTVSDDIQHLLEKLGVQCKEPLSIEDRISILTHLAQTYQIVPEAKRVVTYLVNSLGGILNDDLSIFLPAPIHTQVLHTSLAAQLSHLPSSRFIRTISPVGSSATVCFKVANQEELFLVDDFLVTHNTTVSLGMVHHLETWPLLVVAPLSAFSTWQRQLDEMGKKAYLAVESSKKSWETIKSNQWDAVIVSFDRLHAFVELLEDYGFACLIADEIQRVRTPSSKRSRALRALAGSIPLRIGLSGTPLANRLDELLPIGASLVPHEWTPRATTKQLEDLYPNDPVESVSQHLQALMVRRRMEDTGAKLPGRDDHRVLVDLTPEQRRALEDLQAEAEAAREAGEFDDNTGKIHAFARLHKMRQIINAPSALGLPGPNPKIKAAIDLAVDFINLGRKGVIFCADRATFSDLGRALDTAGIGWVGIWGSTPAKDRIANEKRFHADPNIKVVLCTLQAGAESWSASPTGTFYISTSYLYSPSALAQAEARVFRLSSDPDGPRIQVCYVHARVPGGEGLDDRMVEILEEKRHLIAQVVDQRSHIDPTKIHLSMSDLMFLMTGKKDEARVLQEKDSQAAVQREQDRKLHARRSAHKHKRVNKDLALDDGSQTLTLEQIQEMLDSDPDHFDELIDDDLIETMEDI